MKGVVLAGGLGSRLKPLTNVTNKHLLPIYNKPMIFYPIETLVKAGIDEIMVITGGQFAGDFLRVLKNGKELGVKHLEYAYQETEGGIADALKLAKDFAASGEIAVILGDNTTDFDLSEDVKDFKDGAKVFAKVVDDPNRYGVLKLRDGCPFKIVEKPAEFISDLAVTGLYLYSFDVFDKLATLTPSNRGELEITDINNKYIEEGRLSWNYIDGFWSDAGTFDSLFASNLYWATK